MPIQVQCACGERLKALEQFAGKRAQCPVCGRIVKIPEPGAEPVVASVVAGAGGKTAAAAADLPATKIKEFLDPPAAPIPRPKRPVSLRPMLEALLDPRSIQWMLILGGGVAVLGLIIYLASWGIFENPIVLAVAMGIGTLALLGTGWWVKMRTRFGIALSIYREKLLALPEQIAKHEGLFRVLSWR